MIVLSIAGTIILLLVLVSFRERPKLSVLLEINHQKEQKNQQRTPFIQQLKLLKVSGFWLASISSSLTISLYYTFSTVVG